MSHHKSSKSSRKGSSGGSIPGFPTKWSAWEWSEEHACHQRWRQIRPGSSNNDYEWEYGQFQPTSPSEPRTSALDSIPETDQQHDPPLEYPSQDEYTTAAPESAAVEEITHNFDQVRISSPASSFSSYTAPAYTPAAENTASFRYIKTRNPHTFQEEFDPHYKVHDSWQFKWGRVFKVLWAEPSGSNDEDGTVSGTGTQSVRKIDGKKIHEKVRRFVIINALDGHCICLPIMTYGGQGVLKKGVHAKYHTAIYSDKAQIFRGEKERGMTKRPIRITTSSPRHKLDKASRLNYAKVYTVEHNVKVWFIGHVHKNSEWQLGTDYNAVHPPLQARGVPPPPDDTFSHAQGGNTNFTPGGWGSNYNPTTVYPQSNTLFPGASGGSQPQPFSSMGLAPASWSPGGSQYLAGSARRPSYPVAGGPPHHSGQSSHAEDDERSSHLSRRGSDYNVDYNVDYSEHTAENVDQRSGQYGENVGQASVEDKHSSYDQPAPQPDFEGEAQDYHNYGQSVDQDVGRTTGREYHGGEEGGHDDVPNIYDEDA